MRILIWRVSIPQSAAPPPQWPGPEDRLDDDAFHQPAEAPAPWRRAAAPLALWLEKLKDWSQR
jgi:hypothetical protein